MMFPSNTFLTCRHGHSWAGRDSTSCALSESPLAASSRLRTLKAERGLELLTTLQSNRQSSGHLSNNQTIVSASQNSLGHTTSVRGFSFSTPVNLPRSLETGRGGLILLPSDILCFSLTCPVSEWRILSTSYWVLFSPGGPMSQLNFPSGPTFSCRLTPLPSRLCYILSILTLAPEKEWMNETSLPFPYRMFQINNS